MTPIPDHISTGLTRERLALEVRRARGPFAIWLTLLVAAIAAGGLILYHLDLPWPWQSDYSFTVAASDTSGVVSGDEVRIAGVDVGRVTGVSLQHGQPVIAATMGPQYGPIYRDARLALRPNTPLQDMYLDIENRGNRRAGALRDGIPLPVAQTQAAVQIGSVVDIFDAAVRPRVGAAIDALGDALGSQGANFRRGLTALAPFLQAARQLTSVLATRRVETAQLVHNLGLMTDELAGRDTQVRSLVSGGSVTLQRVASVESSLSALIKQLPPTLSVLPGSFSAVRTAAAQLQPALSALLPTARALGPALASLRQLSPVADSALTALDRPLPGLTALLRTATPLSGRLARAFAELTPQAPRVNHITAAVIPCELAVDRFFNWTQSTTKYYDANGTIPRAAAVVGVGSVGNTPPEKYLTAGPSCAAGAPAGGAG
jgi:virulence factor Mce-like protein